MLQLHYFRKIGQSFENKRIYNIFYIKLLIIYFYFIKFFKFLLETQAGILSSSWV